MLRTALTAWLIVIGLTAFSQPNCVYMASDVYPGAPGGIPVLMTEYNGALYFRATGNASGQELWKYENGVSTMAADVNPGSGGSFIANMTVMGGDLYFTAFTPATGMELFKYDGVSASLAADINPGAAGSSLSYLTAIGSELYFSADDGSTGYEPWKFDGTNATQVADINPGSGSSNPNEYGGAGGYVYFPATTPATGEELYRYDGATATLFELNPGAGGADIGEITPIGSKVCFRATNGSQGYELWEHDGTNATCLDVNPGAADFTPWDFVEFGGEVYYRGFIAASGYELWKFDGSTASLVADINPGGGNGHPNNFVAGTTKLYFGADDGNTGNELFVFDGTNVTLVGDIRPGTPNSMPNGASAFPMTTIGDELYCIADDGNAGYEVWGYHDGILEMGRDIVAGSGTSNPAELIGFGDSLFFMADDLVNGAELWKWDPDADLTSVISVVTCGEWYSPSGTLYNTPGIYNFNDTIPSIYCPGCDSVINVKLTLTDTNEYLDIITCDNYISPAGGFYTSPGTYTFTDTLSSTVCPGTDSLIHIDLEILTNLNTAIFTIPGVIFVSQTGANYQWLDCDDDYNPIPGETNADFLPTVDGNYCCIISIGSCVDTTDCLFAEAETSGITAESESTITAYPNPVSNQLFIANSNYSPMSIRIFNGLGKEVHFEQFAGQDLVGIDMTRFAKGLYHLEISTPEGVRFEKVIKQ